MPADDEVVNSLLSEVERLAAEFELQHGSQPYDRRKFTRYGFYHRDANGQLEPRVAVLLKFVDAMMERVDDRCGRARPRIVHVY